jgi:hypothetical protein
VAFLLVLVVIVHLSSVNLARGKAKQWLCQVDDEIYRDCAEAMGTATTTTARGGAGASAPSPTPITRELTPPAPDAPAGATATPSPTPTPIPTPGDDECGQGVYEIADEQQARLDRQLYEIKNHIKFHGDVMGFFFTAYYLAISMMLFGGVLVAVALFFIAQSGWGPANPYVKTIFVVMAAITAYYGLFPPVFQQQKNIADNMALLLEYQTLRREVESYPQTCTTVVGEMKKTPGNFINYVNSEMKRLGKIAIGFDYTKIDYKGALDISRDNPPSGQGDQPGGNANKGK